MKLNQSIFAAIRKADGHIQETPEGDMIAEDKRTIVFMLVAWNVPKSDIEIKRVKIVLDNTGTD